MGFYDFLICLQQNSFQERHLAVFYTWEVKESGPAPSWMHTVETSLAKESGDLPFSILQSMLFLFDPGQVTLLLEPQFLHL